MSSLEDKFYYGFSKTAFKFQAREHTNCFNNGLQFLYYTIELAYKLFTDPKNDELTYDFNDTMIMTLDLCNYWDTIEGVLFLNLIYYMLEYFQNNYFLLFEKRTLSVLKWAVRIFDLLSLFNDIADFSGII